MRVTSMVAGLALVLAACGGEKKPAESGAATPSNTPAAATPAPAATAGVTHDVDMTMVNGQPRYVPDNLTIKAGDVVRFENKEGGPHDVMFYADSIPAGAQAVLDANMTDKTASLTSQMAVDPEQKISISFANAPAGTYRFTCQPHGAMGMHGTITVQ